MPDFRDIVHKASFSWCTSKSHVGVRNRKVRYFRKLVEGWSAGKDVTLRNHKNTIMLEYESLYIKSETHDLTNEEKIRMGEILKDLNSCWVVQEVRDKQRARDRDIIEGDRNNP